MSPADLARSPAVRRFVERIREVQPVFRRTPAPASTMVEICKMTSPDYLIEINAIAVLPTK
jgi:enamine deaminase RidA (YjgF/YER057c/UK114 family)